ncbi:MAG: hypothetical protein ACXWZL_06640 [Mycobacterium sp.]
MTFVRRMIPAAFFIAAAALGGSAFSDPATACAAPREWDVGGYDQCWQSGIGRGFNDEEWNDHVKYCCLTSGGDWDGSKCVAPPAEPAGATPQFPSGVSTHTLEPMPPPVIRNPGTVTETFAPAPIG